MNPERPRNLAASVLQRLLDHARERSDDFNYVADLLRGARSAKSGGGELRCSFRRLRPASETVLRSFELVVACGRRMGVTV